MTEKAIVLFSGGQDSTTCLAWALDRFAAVETVAFDYRQRHKIELSCGEKVAAALNRQFPHWGARLDEAHRVDLGVLRAISDTALTGEVEIAFGANGLPTTFVPGRNLVFLTFAAAIACRRGAKYLVAGMCDTDYSGYPDCRDDTLKAMQVALNLGMAQRFVIDTPLMWIDKAQTFALAGEIGGDRLMRIVLEHTHSCYIADRSHQHDLGFGCR